MSRAVGEATAKPPAPARVESDTLPGRTPPSSAGAINGSRDGDSHRAAKASGLAWDDTIRRVQESWEATTVVAGQPNDAYEPDNPDGVHRSRLLAMLEGRTEGRTEDVVSPTGFQARVQRMRKPHLSPAANANSHLGKRSSSGDYEDVLERKRRAVAHEPSTATPTSTDHELEASRRRPGPAAAMVNGASADKRRDGPQVLRAVRSAPNKPLSPALRGVAEPMPKPPPPPGVQVLEKTASGRPYKSLRDGEGKLTSALGALIPDGYEKHDDDASPWICPVRDCRRLFKQIVALGAHFSAKHRCRNLNDNGDGTLSIVGEYTGTPGQITPRIVSRKPLDRGEPPMAFPRVPPHSKNPPNYRPSPVETERPATAAPRRPSRVIPPPVDPLPSPPMPALATDLGAYLRTILPSNFNFGAFGTSKEGPLILQMAMKRRATTEWKQRMTSLKKSGSLPRSALSFLLFLTGNPAEDPCPSCVTSDSGEECIVPSPSFPSFILDRFGGSCAACYYRCNRWHQKNQCLLHAGGAPTPGAKSRASSFGDMSMAVDPADEDSEELEPASLAASEPEVTSWVASEDENSPAEEPARKSGTSVLQPPALEPRSSSSTRGGQGATEPGSLLNAGNLMPADVLEMEDWEIAPGTIRNASDEPDNIAFSNAYLFSNAAVPIMDGVGFNVITLKPGGLHKFPAQQSLRLCSLATGKLSVKMEQEDGDSGFQIGPNGMFKMMPGTVASVRNRVYIDAVLHVTTMECKMDE